MIVGEQAVLGRYSNPLAEVGRWQGRREYLLEQAGLLFGLVNRLALAGCA
ncbi:hypothetical protein EYZ11_012402 [Aspergillus tanneri]|uniref:Uncharacterized protein n=1 Tax=Aspergillus tanneri TaxID=1220188 RepID=A0A4S3J0C4_9EURO|nr:hypothetical protein EYZ11_012402 [Aspergillus tanneri]